MACKKPILATNVGGLSELVIQDINGILIPINSATAIADSLAHLSSLPNEKLEDMGLNSRKIIERDYLKEVVFDSIIQSYDL